MNKFRIHFPFIISIAVTVVCLVGVGFWFNRNTEDMIEKYIYGSLEDNCKAQAATFNTRLNDQLEILRDISRYFDDVDMNNFNEVKKVIFRMKSINTFRIFGVCDKNGNGATYRGDIFKSSGIKFYEEAMKGRDFVYKNTSNVNEFGEVILVSIPIKKYSDITGVIFGIFTKDEFNELIMGLNPNQESASLLLLSDGAILARSKNPQLITDRIENFFDLGTAWGLNGKDSLSILKNSLDSNESLVVPYETGTKKRLAVMAPVGDKDWYYAIITPQTVITDLSQTLSNQVIIIEAILSLTFLLLLSSILYLHNNNIIINKSNEKFKMATKQNQTVVFDYDFTKKTMEFSGDTEFINGTQIDRVNAKQMTELLRLVHKDDSFFIHEVFSISTQKETDSINREIRLLCFDNHYYWFKLIGTVVRDENQNPRHFVGNIVNVDETVNKEQILKKKAELDPLTGLLNKGAFQESVTKALQDSSPFDIYAFYIIDLDNFKKVNDTMGHIVGDQVLADTAKKLCVIFSDADFLGRIGGDEFTAFLRLTYDGKKYAEKIIESKAKAICARLNEVYSDGTSEVNVSASVGVALYPLHGAKYENLYKNADSVLYKSKNGGKNQFTIYNETITHSDDN